VDMLGMGMALRRMKNIERYGNTGYFGEYGRKPFGVWESKIGRVA